MGCCSSNEAGTAQGKATKPDSELEKLLAVKVKKYIEDNKLKAAKSLNQIIMKFPQILKAFGEMRKMFQQIDTDNNGTIDKAEFTAACTKMQVTDSHVVDMIYSETDMNHDQQVDFKEFILMIACLYLTADIKTDEGNTIANALNKVLEAFMFFDSDNDGFIEKSEVTKVLNESTPVGGNGSNVLTSARFEEMDWDHNARVSFKEFLFAVESWVGLDEEDED